LQVASCKLAVGRLLAAESSKLQSIILAKWRHCKNAFFSLIFKLNSNGNLFRLVSVPVVVAVVAVIVATGIPSFGIAVHLNFGLSNSILILSFPVFQVGHCLYIVAACASSRFS